MTKYKLTRKQFFKKYGNDMPYHLRVELLATISPEEQSQKIMMEQVDKDFYGESIGMREQEKINRVRNTIRNNELNTLVGKLKCNGKKHFFDKGNVCNCGSVSFNQSNPIKDSKPIKEIELMDLQKFSLNDLGLTPPENHMIRLKINELVEAVNHLNQIK